MTKKEIINKINEVVPISHAMRALLEQLSHRDLIIKLEEYREWVKQPIVTIGGRENE